MDEEVIPILKVADAARAVAWYRRLGFAQEWLHRFGPEFPAFVSVAQGRARLFLSEHQGDARPDTLIYIRVNDIDAVAKEFGVVVEDQPWARECHLTDPNGNRLRIGTPTG
jgi:catechol 2,3-dioxygenase-like lactoylglutathione lyase family enzyme